MTDWKLLGKALDAGIPEAQLERIAPVLEALEAAFRPLARNLSWETDPAPVFNAAGEDSPSEDSPGEDTPGEDTQ